MGEYNELELISITVELCQKFNIELDLKTLLSKLQEEEEISEKEYIEIMNMGKRQITCSGQ